MEEGFVLSRNWDRNPFFYNGIHRKKYQRIVSELDSLERIGKRGDAIQYINFNPQGKMEDLEDKIPHDLLEEFKQGIGIGYIKESPDQNNERHYELTDFGRKSYLISWSGRETPKDVLYDWIFDKILQIK